MIYRSEPIDEKSWIDPRDEVIDAMRAELAALRREVAELKAMAARVPGGRAVEPGCGKNGLDNLCRECADGLP